MTTEPDNNSLNIQPRSYTNSVGKNILKYLFPDSMVLDLPFILTTNKRLTKGMPYLKLEQRIVGNDIAAVRLLDFGDADGIVYLNVQELQNERTYTLSANMDYDGDYWLWSLSDLETLIKLPK